jgi:hypothetical protein
MIFFLINEKFTSLHRNSRIELRRTFRPSAVREKGVLPAPLNCNSHRSFFLLITSPRYLKIFGRCYSIDDRDSHCGT